jgi:hypothetical protein
MEAATLEAPAHTLTEAPAPVPEPTIAEILDQHLSHAQQTKVAVETLSKIPFLIAPDGTKAISTEEIKSPAHREIVEASLKTVLGERIDNAPYLPAREGIGEKLGLSSGSNFVQLDGRGTIKMLADAGVKDFAAALEEKKEHGHAARLR